MGVLYATLLTLVSFNMCDGRTSSIIWQILTLPIKFGKDVTLFCNASVVKNCCTNTVTWMRDFNVIVHHGASTNSSKYSQKQRSDGFSLIIKKFDEGDINHRYTCLYDFFSYGADLRIDRHNFQYSPNKDEIKANINKTSDKLISADVMFEKVYPPPDCILVANKEKVQMNTNVTVEEEVQTGLFYKIKLHLVCEIHTNKCMDSVEVLCTIGKYDVVIYKENFTCTDNSYSFGSEEKSSDQKNVLVFIYTGLPLCTAVIVSVLLWWKIQSSSSKICLSTEGGGTHSRRSANCCVPFCRRPNSGTDEVSSHINLLQNYSGGDTHSRRSANCSVPFYRRPNSGTNEVSSNSHLLQNYSGENGTIQLTKPPQKENDVMNMVNNIRIYDKASLETLVYDTKIDIARRQRPILSVKSFDSVSVPSSTNGDSGTIQLTGPAQKEKDVMNMIDYARVCDKTYDEKVASDKKINDARRQRPIPSVKLFGSVSPPSSTNVSDMDVFKCSSRIPTWGLRKRSRISITCKMKPANE